MIKLGDIGTLKKPSQMLWIKSSVRICSLHHRGSGSHGAASPSAASGRVEQVILLQVVIQHFELVREDFQLLCILIRQGCYRYKYFGSPNQIQNQVRLVLLVLTDTKIWYHSTGKWKILYLLTRYRAKLGWFFWFGPIHVMIRRNLED